MPTYRTGNSSSSDTNPEDPYDTKNCPEYFYSNGKPKDSYIDLFVGSLETNINKRGGPKGLASSMWADAPDDPTPRRSQPAPYVQKQNPSTGSSSSSDGEQISNKALLAKHGGLQSSRFSSGHDDRAFVSPSQQTKAPSTYVPPHMRAINKQPLSANATTNYVPPHMRAINKQSLSANAKEFTPVARRTSNASTLSANAPTFTPTKAKSGGPALNATAAAYVPSSAGSSLSTTGSNTHGGVAVTSSAAIISEKIVLKTSTTEELIQNKEPQEKKASAKEHAVKVEIEKSVATSASSSLPSTEATTPTKQNAETVVQVNAEVQVANKSENPSTATSSLPVTSAKAVRGASSNILSAEMSARLEAFEAINRPTMGEKAFLAMLLQKEEKQRGNSRGGAISSTKQKNLPLNTTSNQNKGNPAAKTDGQSKASSSNTPNTPMKEQSILSTKPNTPTIKAMPVQPHRPGQPLIPAPVNKWTTVKLTGGKGLSKADEDFQKFLENKKSLPTMQYKVIPAKQSPAQSTQQSPPQKSRKVTQATKAEARETQFKLAAGTADFAAMLARRMENPNSKRSTKNVAAQDAPALKSVPKVIATATASDVTNTVPEVTTTVPEVTTTVPEVATTVPEVATTIPEVATTVPEITATVPEVVKPTPHQSVVPELQATSKASANETQPANKKVEQTIGEKILSELQAASKASVNDTTPFKQPHKAAEQIVDQKIVSDLQAEETKSEKANVSEPLKIESEIVKDSTKTALAEEAISSQDQLSHQAVQSLPLNKKVATQPTTQVTAIANHGVPSKQNPASAAGSVEIWSVSGFSAGRIVTHNVLKEGIRATKGQDAADCLADWDGGWMAPPIWDERPGFNTDHIPEYIREWAKSVIPGGCKLELSLDGFMSGELHVNNFRLDQAPGHEPTNPDIENASSEKKRRGQTSNTASEICRKRMDQEQKAREYSIAQYKLQQDEIEAWVPEPNPFAPKMNTYLRPAMESDAKHIMRIYNWYTSNTNLTEDHEPITESDVVNIMKTLKEARLPFIVAVKGRLPTQPQNTKTKLKLPQYEHVIGFAFAEARGVGLTGSITGRSRYTANMQLYVDHDFTRRRIGGSLMDRLLIIMSRSRGARGGYDWLNLYNDPLHEADGPRRCHQLLIELATLGKNDPDFAWRKAFLLQFWFMEESRLKSVGRSCVKERMGEWLDIVYFQTETAQRGDFTPHD